MDLIETLRKKGDSKIKEIEKILEETAEQKEKHRETAKYALSMAIRLYEELIKEKGALYVKLVYPEILDKISEITDDLLEYES